ncbi:MAG: UDP-N-acetylglucosamine 1-carboxyvinyltransferase, partial [Lentisphaeria bacterium]|nr:UDP-N-acetylglucosamine 1-carboxyvinyltransferase [Lentisphaeria bacterium]
MRDIIIEGPARTQGIIRPGGNKNAALPIIAAAMLTDEQVVLHNLPNILDADAMLNLARQIGASVTRSGTDVTIHAKNIEKSDLPRQLCASIRASILFGAPVTIRCGEATVGLPGGDFIGRRRLDSHYYGLNKLGISHKLSNGAVTFKQDKPLTGSDMFLDEASVTATEHILIAAVLAKGTTIIRNAAAEPHVQQLAEFLNKMGAQISGIDTNTYVIKGVEKLHGCEYELEADHIEVASFLCMAAATGGSVEFEG